jgi:hypothetical protein
LLPQQAYAVPEPLRLDALVGGGLVDLPGGSTLPVRVIAVLAIGLAVGLLAERLLLCRHVWDGLRPALPGHPHRLRDETAGP